MSSPPGSPPPPTPDFESKRCSATTAAGGQCRRQTLRDGLCYQHLARDKHLAIKDSRVPGGGKGLFTVEDRQRPEGERGRPVFRKEDRIDVYDGELLTAAQLDRRYPGDTGRYVLQLSRNKYIDARNPTSCVARWANSSTDARRRNARLTPGNWRGGLRATKNIGPDTEILTSYGTGDPEHHGMVSLERATRPVQRRKRGWTHKKRRG
jgi:hypothetical protein